MQRGFSFAEILVAMALAALTGSIAVVNHRLAQTETNATRAKADLRSLGMAVEAYNIDWKMLPLDGDDDPYAGSRGTPMMDLNRASDLLPEAYPGPDANSGMRNRVYYFRTYRTWSVLTTPVPYISSVKIEPFSAFIPYGRQDHGAMVSDPPFMLLTSCGPDRTIVCTDTFAIDRNGVMTTNLFVPPPGSTIVDRSINTLDNLYDPTNGAASWGEIYRFAAVKDRAIVVKTYGSLLPGDYTP